MKRQTHTRGSGIGRRVAIAVLGSTLLACGSMPPGDAIARAEAALRRFDCGQAGVMIKAAGGDLSPELKARKARAAADQATCPARLEVVRQELRQRFPADWSKLEVGLSYAQVSTILAPYGGLGMSSGFLSMMDPMSVNLGTNNYVLHFGNGKLQDWQLRGVRRQGHTTDLEFRQGSSALADPR